MVEAAPVKNLLKRHLTPRQIESLRKLFWAVGGFWYRSDLVRLAAFFQTDKWGDHRYAQHYQRYFAPLRRKNLHRSEEHTSELQSRLHLVCRLLLEKKKKITTVLVTSRDETSRPY